MTFAHLSKELHFNVLGTKTMGCHNIITSWFFRCGNAAVVMTFGMSAIVEKVNQVPVLLPDRATRFFHYKGFPILTHLTQHMQSWHWWICRAGKFGMVQGSHGTRGGKRCSYMILGEIS
ncbi:hypothetical protein AOLI_G00266770 [Acnodon oligacanthus]